MLVVSLLALALAWVVFRAVGRSQGQPGGIEGLARIDTGGGAA